VVRGAAEIAGVAVFLLPVNVLAASILVSPPRPSERHLDMSITIFDEITFWHWLIAGVILIALEMAVPGVVFMWIGIAAIITGVVSWASPDLAMEWLLIIFAVLSVLSVVLGRTYLKRNPLQSDHPKLNRRGEQYVGRHFTLSEPIVGGFGKIKVDDSTWKVSGEDMAVGAKVEVVAVDGVVLKVEARD